MNEVKSRGATVIVRTFRDRPCIRKLWHFGPVGSVVAEDAAFNRLLRGDESGAVFVPSEDVFEYDAELAARLDPKTAFGGWGQLRRYDPRALGGTAAGSR